MQCTEVLALISHPRRDDRTLERGVVSARPECEVRLRPASAFAKLSRSKASDSDSALGTAGKHVNLSRR